MVRAFLRGLAVAGLVALLPLGTIAAAPGPPPPAVDSRVREALARGEQADVLIVTGPQPDLSPAGLLPTKEARGKWVVETLRASAEQSQAALTAELERSGVPYRRFWAVNAVQARVGPLQIERVLAVPGVERVVANNSFRGVEPPAATEGQAGASALQGIEWGVSRVNAPWAWSHGYTGQGIVVSGQDTGYSWDHPALMNAYRGYNPATGITDHNSNWHDSIHAGTSSCGLNLPAPCDDDGHGTHTMGTMAGNDLVPGSTSWPSAAPNAIGVAPGARWMGCRNMASSIGTPATYIECFEWMLAPYPITGTVTMGDPARAPDVMNNSWHCPPSEGCTSDTLGVIEPALDAADAAGILVIVSAGNSGSACGTIWDPPAIYPRALVVGATAGDSLASFSSRGPVTYRGTTYVKPDLAAPGVSVGSSWPGAAYWTLSGTSMAGPHVVGVAALLMSAQPSLRGQTGLVKAILERTADHVAYATCGAAAGGVPNNGFGWGIVNAQRAIGSLDLSATLTGTVSEAGTGVPLAGAQIALYALGASVPVSETVADDLGRYGFGAPWGSYQVVAQSPGYAAGSLTPVYLVGGQTTVQEIPLVLRAPADLGISPAQADIDLRWTKTGVAADHQYEVWRGTTPYFTPGDSSSGPLPLATVSQPVTGTIVSYRDLNVLGYPGTVHFYVVRTTSASGGSESPPSNRVGGYDFPLYAGD